MRTKRRCAAAAPLHTAGHPALGVSVTSERQTRVAVPDWSAAEERHTLTPAVRVGEYGAAVTALQSLQLTGGWRRLGGTTYQTDSLY